MTLLPSLDWLDLSDNALSGPMPPLPPSVRWVDLSNNKLIGGVKLPVAPRHAEDSVALVLLNVANNMLTGTWLLLPVKHSYRRCGPWQTCFSSSLWV